MIQLPGVDSASSASTTSPNGQKQAPSAENGEKRGNKPQDDTEDLGAKIRNRFPTAFEDFDFDQELLAQSVELEEDFKRELYFVYEQLDEVNYYELLGAGPDAGRRDFRSNYFRMSKRYHPDRFYQKILGDYATMIEQIFQRVTKAYQTLSNRNKRKKYDAALQAGYSTSAQSSTPAGRRSEPREEIKGNRKRDMAFKVLVQRGDKALTEGRVAVALKEFRKALSLKRDLALALRVAQALLDKKDHLDDATSFARAAQKIDPDNVEALKLLGQLYEQKDEPDDALYHYQKALDAAPDDTEIKAHIARLRDGRV